MELPILPTVHEADPQALIRAVKRAEVILARTICDETSLGGSTAYTHPERCLFPLANFATDLNLVDGIEPPRVIDQILAHFREAGTRCRRLQSSDAQWSGPWVDAITPHGYVPCQQNIHLLRQHKVAPTETGSDDQPGGIQIIPARSAYAQVEDWFRGIASKPGNSRGSRDDAFVENYAQAMVGLLDDARLDLSLARIQGRATGTAGVVTLGQIGVIYGVDIGLCHWEEGVGGALLTHVIDHCARAQFERVIVVLGDHDPMEPVFESQGFQKITSFISYVADPIHGAI